MKIREKIINSFIDKYDIDKNEYGDIKQMAMYYCIENKDCYSCEIPELCDCYKKSIKVLLNLLKY